ncbi:SLAM family member 8-like isoform X2 [Vulpes vulpes]|uniref:SLAM family member 8-like isoform X2 n=1 Tax=Vulpes vulpes TaxID=9627 RepID=A0ABM4YEK1_VULVU
MIPLQPHRPWWSQREAPAMGPCSGDPHLGGASWRLGLTSLLLSVCSTGTQGSAAHGSGGDDSGNPVSLKQMQGASVLFQVLRNPDLPAGVELEKMTWGILSGAKYTAVLRVSPGARDPEWVNFQEKFQKRVRVLNMTTLRMNNLTLDDTGLYRVWGSYTRGIMYDQDFHLTVYEPLPLLQIRTTNLSITPGWCNVTVQCDAPETREDLIMSWESRGLPWELEQREAAGPAHSPWTLALSLPLSQTNASLTCVLRNQVDQKTATLDLGDICGHDPQGQADFSQLPTILRVVVVLLLILGAGLFLWRTRVKKSLEPGRGRSITGN